MKKVDNLTLQKQMIKRRKRSVPDTAAMTTIAHVGSSSAILYLL